MKDPGGGGHPPPHKNREGCQVRTSQWQRQLSSARKRIDVVDGRWRRSPLAEQLPPRAVCLRTCIFMCVRGPQLGGRRQTSLRGRCALVSLYIRGYGGPNLEGWPAARLGVDAQVNCVKRICEMRGEFRVRIELPWGEFSPTVRKLRASQELPRAMSHHRGLVFP